MQLLCALSLRNATESNSAHWMMLATIIARVVRKHQRDCPLPCCVAFAFFRVYSLGRETSLKRRSSSDQAGL
jgi:hypothetical protein